MIVVSELGSLLTTLGFFFVILLYISAHFGLGSDYPLLL